MLKTCKYCKKDFEARRSHAEFCSSAHRAAYAHALPFIEFYETEIAKLKARIAQLETELERERAYIKELEAGSHVDEPAYEDNFNWGA